MSGWKEYEENWEEHVTRMNVERWLKNSGDNIPAGKGFLGRPKRKWSDLILIKYIKYILLLILREWAIKHEYVCAI